VILDMENQYLQVKTQVAVSIADQHMLEKKWRENEDSGKDWMHKAEIAVDKSQDDLARAALDRFQTSQRLAQSYREQVDDQKLQVETLKGAICSLRATGAALLWAKRRSRKPRWATTPRAPRSTGSKTACITPKQSPPPKSNF
jgi:phage shock protein A